ncbi:GNAT family N-acetyltransferase [Streptomyces sp. ESR1.13]|uniref:GNAT family N-acetyltransferase n=1 Tax=unclassified Streptomyces TaxID=2593676 RepID=UPI00404277CC
MRSEARKECSGPLDERVLVAEVTPSERFGAVVAHSRPDDTYVTWVHERMGWEGPVRLLRVIAVAKDHQGRGLGHEAMDTAFDDIDERESGDQTFVLALIHERNERSQMMALKHQLELAPFPCPGAPGMQYWFATT